MAVAASLPTAHHLTSPYPSPRRRRRRIRDAHWHGIVIEGANTRGLLKGCDVVGSRMAGVAIKDEADPTLTGCK